jgi:hypothetical protein
VFTTVYVTTSPSSTSLGHAISQTTTTSLSSSTVLSASITSEAASIQSSSHSTDLSDTLFSLHPPGTLMPMPSNTMGNSMTNDQEGLSSHVVLSIILVFLAVLTCLLMFGFCLHQYMKRRDKRRLLVSSIDSSVIGANEVAL